MQGKAHIIYRTSTGQPPDLHEGYSEFHILLVKDVGHQFPANHQADDLFRRGFTDRHATHALTVSQNHHAVRDAEDFLQTMRNKYDCNTLFLERLNDAK